MTEWGIASLVQIISTTQSRQTSESVVDWKWSVSAGIFAALISAFSLCGHLRSFESNFGLRSLHPKIPFPAAGFQWAKDPVRRTWKSGILGECRCP